MNIEIFRDFCLQKKGVTEEMPFGPDTLVFKVMGKVFALTGLDTTPFTVNLKCEPRRAEKLRDIYPDYITGAYHMNKKHWNSVQTEFLPPALVTKLIDHSYDLVVQKLPKKVREELQNL